ncbi:hypothetical protein L484_007505 [Morus notabilis]|uniref:Disease resistance protein At4g27190-like leucine-rich repeats domain-containing protein n=1 Tax=Morus notabilis TaxID=981085 RepID=W9SD34_9ROSA|nr:hypothetical protein L484_007505 [Morus notabilis]
MAATRWRQYFPVEEKRILLNIIEIEVVENIEFPRLCSLTLGGLPKLIQFCEEVKKARMTLPHRTQEQLNVDSDLPLFHPKLLASSTTFPNLKELFVNRTSGSSKYLFPASVAANLVQLNRLEIKDCTVMEEMISTDQTMARMLLPQLNYLELKHLPKLTRFCTSSVRFLSSLFFL